MFGDWGSGVDAQGLMVRGSVIGSRCGYYYFFHYLARRSLCEIINSTLGMLLIHRWIGGTLFRTCIKLKSKQREKVVYLSICAFHKCVQK